MRPFYSCLFLSVIVHGLIFSIVPAKPVTKVIRLEEVRLDEKKPIRLVSPRPAPPSRPVPPATPPFSRQERKRPSQKKKEKAVPKVGTQRAEASERGRLHPAPPVAGETQAPMIEQPLLPVKEPVETPVPLKEQVERPEEAPVERPVTEAVGLSEPSAEASSPEAPPVSENLFESPVFPFPAGEAPQTASISTPAEEGQGLSHPAIEGIRDDYLARLREAIEAARRYPDRARRMGQEGRVVVRFIVRAGGEVGDVDLAEPSSFPLLNRAAEETIGSLHAVPPLPPEIGERLEVAIPIVYRLERSAGR